MLSTYLWRIIKIMAENTATATMIPITRQKIRMASVFFLDCPVFIFFGSSACISEEKKYLVIIMFKFSNESGILSDGQDWKRAGLEAWLFTPIFHDLHTFTVSAEFKRVTFYTFFVKAYLNKKDAKKWRSRHVECDTCHLTAVKHRELQFLKTRKKLWEKYLFGTLQMTI